MKIRIVKNLIRRAELAEIAREGFGDVVKAVVDVEQEIMALGGELHADEEVHLVEEEKSLREHTWGINLYPEKTGAEFIEFDSMINLKPAYGNRSRGVESPEVRARIEAVVRKLVSG